MSLLLHPRLADCRRIFLDEISVSASIGFHDFERAAPQRILLCVQLFVPISGSTSASDDVADVLDYDRVREGLITLAQSRHFNLQESLIDQGLDFLLGLPSVRLAILRTQKPDVYPDCQTVGIETLRWATSVPGAV